MALIIDGYNLIHAAGILGRGLGPGSLERARAALVASLAASLDASVASETTVVFDAADAPPGLAATIVRQQGITLRYSRGYACADELIEELIAADSAPRRLVVVSSDHRLHRAARRRKARAVDSDVWFAELLARRRTRQALPDPPKPEPPFAESEIDYWLSAFGERPIDESPSTGGAEPEHRLGTEPDKSSPEGEKPTRLFPPGYLDEIWKDE